MTVYERITYRPEGATKSRTIHLQAPGKVDIGGIPHTTGAEVGKNGDLKDRHHIITDTLISKRTPMKMNLHYEELEPCAALHTDVIDEHCDGCGEQFYGWQRVQITPSHKVLCAECQHRNFKETGERWQDCKEITARELVAA